MQKSTITVSTKDLKKALALVKLKQSRNFLPVLGCVSVSIAGDRLTLRTTNMAIWAQAKVTGVSEGAGAGLADYTSLISLTKVSSDTETVITIIETENKPRLTVNGVVIPDNHATLADFPEDLPDGDPFAVLPHVELARAFTMTSMEYDTRRSLTTIQVARAGATVRLTATDSYRLYRATTNGQAMADETREVMLPRDLVAVALKAKAANYELRVATGGYQDNTYQLAALLPPRLSIMFSTRHESGQFPDCDRIMPAVDDYYRLELDKNALLDALKRVKPALPTSRSVKVSFPATNTLTLHAETPDGGLDITETVTIGGAVPYVEEIIDGDPVKVPASVMLNADFLTSCLLAVDEPTLYVHHEPTKNPVELLAQDKEELSLLMPLRV